MQDKLPAPQNLSSLTLSSSNISALPYDDAFEQTGHGSFSRLATFACSLIFIHAVLEMSAIGFIITPAECDLNLTVLQKSLVNSGVFMGILFTAICWGILADKFGRRRIMLPATVATVIVSFLSSICSVFWVMFLFRLLTGFLVSASSATVLVYLAELQDNKHRDRSISYAITSAQFAFVVMPALAWIIIPLDFSVSFSSFTIRSWRVFMWFWGAVGLTGAIILIFLPESPRYVFSAKGSYEALPILAKIYAWNLRTDASLFPVKSIIAVNAAPEMGMIESLTQMMKAPIRRCILLTHWGIFNVFLLSNGLYIWIPDLLNAALFQYSRSINMCVLITEHISKQNVVQKHDFAFAPSFHTGLVPYHESCSKGEVNWIVYPSILALETFNMIPFVTVSIIINKFSQAWLFAIIMWISSIGMILCMIIPQAMVAMIFLAVSLACASACCVLTALVVEAVPTSLRGLATCTMYMTGQLGAVAGNCLLGIMTGWPCYLVFVLLAVLCTGSAFAFIFLWPNVEEVKKEMTSKHFTY